MKDLSVFALLLEASLLVQGVVIILILGSLVSWAIFLQKRSLLSRLEKADRGLLDDLKLSTPQKAFSLAGKARESFHANLLLAIQANWPKENSTIRLSVFERALNREISWSYQRLQQYQSLLAVVASSAVFIGLLGTVWGIIDAFQGLSDGGAGLASVAPGIAEALAATAIGLIAAIPASIFYNVLQARIRDYMSELDRFREEILSWLEGLNKGTSK